jgi:hypothetical protein
VRIRSIKPEFWRSQDISSLEWPTRLLFIGLWSYVDDNGVGVDREALIAADLFADDLARDPRDTLATVSRGLQALSERGQIVRYTVGGKQYLEITNWGRHQKIDKPGKERYPRSTSENADHTTEFVEPSRDSRETLAPGTEEQRNRGTEEQQTCATPSRTCPPRFDDFWASYPRRRDRRKAEKAFANALKRADADTIIAGADRYAYDPNRAEQFTKYAEGWLNGDGWLDEPLPTRHSGSNVTAFERKKAANGAVFAALGDDRLELQ